MRAPKPQPESHEWDGTCECDHCRNLDALLAHEMMRRPLGPPKAQGVYRAR